MRFRQKVVEYAIKNNNNAMAARRYLTSRQQVQRWRKKYDGTVQSLANKSRRPHSHPNQHTAEELEILNKKYQYHKHVDIGDIGYNGRTKEGAVNFLGNTHGGMVCIKGQWYIFYHRQTNRQMCARQGCAEPFEIAENGSIAQVEVTSCGLNGGALISTGCYEARIACNLWGKKGVYKYAKPHHTKEIGYPYFTQTGEDREENGDQYIADMTDGSVAGYKYFDFDQGNPKRIAVTYRLDGTGTLEISTSEDFRDIVASLELTHHITWTRMEGSLEQLSGIRPLYFRYRGKGSMDFSQFELV